jgi:hypothetical protein
MYAMQTGVRHACARMASAGGKYWMQSSRENRGKVAAAHHGSADENRPARGWTATLDGRRGSRARVEDVEVEAGVPGSGSCPRKTRTTTGTSRSAWRRGLHGERTDDELGDGTGSELLVL